MITAKDNPLPLPTSSDSASTLQKLDKLGDYTSSTDKMPSLMIAPDVATMNSDVNALDARLKTFAVSSEVLMNVLDKVAKVHPYISDAVLLFKAVITLKLNRRDDNIKLAPPLLRMQAMMSVVVELQNVKETNPAARDRIFLRDSMHELMIQIASHITAFGNYCDYYLKKHFVVKLLKGQMYDSCLAEFDTIFEERQKDIEGALSVHTAMPTNAAINEFTAIPSTTVLLAQAHAHATPSERELKRYIEAKGGVDKFMLDERALEDLVRIRRTHDQSVPGLVAGDGVTGGSWRPSYIRSSEELRSMSQPIRDYEPISGPRHPSYQPRAVQAGAVERGRRSSRGIIGGRPSSRSHSTSPGPPLRVHGRFYPAWRYGGPPIVLTKLKVIRNELDEDLKDGLA